MLKKAGHNSKNRAPSQEHPGDSMAVELSGTFLHGKIY